MSYERAKRILVVCLMLYAVIGFGAHATSTGTEDAYPFFSWFLFVTVPPRVQSGFDIMLVSTKGKSLEAPVPLVSRPDIFSSEEMSEQRLSAITEMLARSIQGQEDGRISELRRQLEAPFSSQASYIVREYTYDPLLYFKTKQVASSTVLAEFRVEKEL